MIRGVRIREAILREGKIKGCSDIGRQMLPGAGRERLVEDENSSAGGVYFVSLMIFSQNPGQFCELCSRFG